jgi:predicted ATPase
LPKYVKGALWCEDGTDGLPLAIELAAARVRSLTPQQIAERLDHALGLLVTEARTERLRLQTMQAALEWSYALVGEPERRLFKRMLLSGTWNLEAVEAVGLAEGLEPAAVLDGLRRLVDQSMVVADPSSDETELRFRLLEQLRQYAVERLEIRGEAEAVHRRHAVYLQDLASTSEPTSGRRVIPSATPASRLNTTKCGRPCAG